jgi:hypothetical protein
MKKGLQFERNENFGMILAQSSVKYHPQSIIYSYAQKYYTEQILGVHE